ncbi:hypothetical protein H4Q26_018412 [Puccinia striiformis f. sp. tritici PST-130]|nr:hypothetical protein H4Q26_018412 [Puccinia striiformis f. sp. tritici PST-130]
MDDYTDIPLKEFELQHRRLGDIVIREFRRLAEKYEPWSGGRPINTPIEELLPIDLVNSKEGLMDWLKSCLLPGLKQHVTTILVLLDPSGLRAEPTAKLMRILAQQSVYDRDMARCNLPLIYFLEELLQFSESQNHIVNLFGDACKDLQQMKLCTDESTYATRGSELNVIQNRWSCPVRGMDERLVREPIIQLTKSVIPLIKLARSLQKRSYKAVKRFGKADTTRGAANTRSQGIDKLIDAIASRLEAAYIS